MSDAATRLELLRLTKPEGISMPDLALWIGRAKELEAWVNESAGQAEAPDMRSATEVTKDRTRAKAPRQPQ